MGQPGLGDVAYLGIGEETTWNSEVPRTKFARLLSETLKLNAGANYPDVGTHGLEQRAAVKQPVFVDGDVTVEMDYDGFGLLLKHLLGSVLTTAPEHRIFPATALNIGLSLEIDRDLASYVYTGCKINSASFSQAQGEILQATFSVIGGAEIKDTATAESFPIDNPVLAEQFTLELNDTIAKIIEWTMDINNNLSGGDRSDLGSLAIKEPVRTAKQIIGGTFTAEFDDTTIYAKYAARDDLKLEMMYNGGDLDTSTADYLLQFIIPTGLLIAGQKNVSGIGPILQSFSWQGRYNTTGDTTALLIVLQNNIAAL